MAAVSVCVFLRSLFDSCICKWCYSTSAEYKSTLMYTERAVIVSVLVLGRSTGLQHSALSTP